MRLSLLAFVLASSGCAATPVASTPLPALPAPSPVATASAPFTGKLDYRSVHLDTLAPDKVDQFVGARKEWVAELTRDHATDGRGVFVQVGANRFYTLRSFAKLGDLESRRASIEKSMEAVPKAAGDRYDALCDSALVFPHASEIWQVDDDLSYAPASGALTEWTADCGVFTSEDVKPDTASSERYWTAASEIQKALARARYPLTRTSFRSVYGAGHLVTLTLARSKAELDAAPSAQAAVAQVLGAEKAAGLFAACESATERHESAPLTIRHDLTQPQAGVPTS